LETARFNVMDVEGNRCAELPQPPHLTPELKEFIQRILVPITSGIAQWLEWKSSATQPPNP
jgi:hypothetical protein